MAQVLRDQGLYAVLHRHLGTRDSRCCSYTCSRYLGTKPPGAAPQYLSTLGIYGYKGSLYPYLEYKKSQSCGFMALILVPGRQRQVDLREFKSSLVYIVSSKLAKPIQ